MCQLFPQDQLESLNFNQEDLNLGRPLYKRIYHPCFQTLATVEYADQKPYYDEQAATYGFKEYKIVRVEFPSAGLTKPWNSAQWGDGKYTRDFAVGKESGFRGKWKIFELGMM